MSLRVRTPKELAEIYIGFPEDMMGCDDEEDSEKVQGWVSCVLDFGRIERRKCAYLGTDKCPHKQGMGVSQKISSRKTYMFAWTNDVMEDPAPNHSGLVMCPPIPSLSGLRGTPKQIAAELEHVRRINSGNDWSYKIYDLAGNNVTEEIKRFWDARFISEVSQ